MHRPSPYPDPFIVCTKRQPSLPRPTCTNRQPSLPRPTCTNRQPSLPRPTCIVCTKTINPHCPNPHVPIDNPHCPDPFCIPLSLARPLSYRASDSTFQRPHMCKISTNHSPRPTFPDPGSRMPSSLKIKILEEKIPESYNRLRERIETLALDARTHHNPPVRHPDEFW